MQRSLAVVLALAACGGEGSSPSTAPVATEAVYAESAGERLVVARVNGEPIYGDCVARQAAAHRIDRRVALDQCIDFELLAQEARRRGLLSHPQVVATSRREAVRALIDADYPLQKPADIPRQDLVPLWDRRVKHAYNHPELRTAVWCRVPIADTDPPERKARAGDIAREIHAALRAEPAPSEDVLARVCAEFGTRYAGEGFDIKHSRYRSDRQSLAKVFADALYALPAEGAVAAPIETQWGWDVIMLGKLEPASARTLDDVLGEVQQQVFERPELEWYREQKFKEWIGPRESKVAIEVHPERIPESRF